MGLKDIIQQDIGVFLNPDEFGEPHNINGTIYTVVVDDDAAERRPRQPIDLYNAANGVYVGRITIYMRAADLNYRPVIGQRWTVDDEPYYIRDFRESAGILWVELEAYQA
jgi:hypothetical protein